MKQLSAIILFCAISQLLFSQKSIKRNRFFKPKGDHTCVYKPKFSVAQQLSFYPFNIADTIKLVSFRYHRRNLPLKDDTIVVDSLLETITLSRQNILNLTDILYNNLNKKPTNYGIISQCFLPRNAVLFIDKSGKLLANILICFQCGRYETSTEEVRLGDDCTEKVDKLRKYFIANGIRFGTDLSISSYLGEALDDEGIIFPKKDN